jgi:hypothetical protein
MHRIGVCWRGIQRPDRLLAATLISLSQQLRRVRRDFAVCFSLSSRQTWKWKNPMHVKNRNRCATCARSRFRLASCAAVVTEYCWDGDVIDGHTLLRVRASPAVRIQCRSQTGFDVIWASRFVE